MICFCRLLQRVISVQSKTNRLPTCCLQPAVFHHSHGRCFSTENYQILSEEKIITTQVLRDLRTTESIWRKHRDKGHFNDFINKCFSRQDYSSSYIVQLLRSACDSFCSCELVGAVLVALSKSVDMNGTSCTLSREQMRDILNCILNTKYITLLQLTCTVFKINEEAENFKDVIDELVRNKKLTEAAYCIGAFNLQKEYDIESIAIPLLIEGKVKAAITCISNCPDTQLKIAQKLDGLLNIRNIDVRALSSSTSRKIFKALSTIVNAFKIPPERCKNLHNIRGRAALNMLIKRRAEQSVLESTWEEMVMSIIAGNPHLKDHLIYKLVMRKDIDTALKMKSKLNMFDCDVAKLASELKVSENSVASTDKINDIEDQSGEHIEDESDPGHLTFNLMSSAIKFIDNKEEFLGAINDISKNYTFIGMDSEWKPHFGLSQERLALIQLAVHDKVYIIDMLSLSNCLEAEIWDKFMDDIFANPKIIKLGCGIMADVQMIVENNKGTKGKGIRFSHILDMAVFYQKLQEVYPEQMGMKFENSKNLLGLSKLCENILGKPLNKEERLCDWEKRPLSESQLEYAALDAYCLLQMYDKLKQISVEKDMNFKHLAKVAIVLTTNLWKPKRKLKGVKSEKSFQIHKPVPVQQFKILLDPELELLGKQLRYLGADVVPFNKTDSPQDIAQLSKSENRLIICSESLWKQISPIIPFGFCCNAVTSEGTQITASEIIQRFNVKINAKDILSPCVVCNNDEVIRLSADAARELHEQLTLKNNNAVERDSNVNNLQRILSAMNKSGIDIKFNDQLTDSVFEKTGAYLCTKCGTVQ